MRLRFRDGPHHRQPQPAAPATATPDNRSQASDARKTVADMRAPMWNRIRAYAARLREHYGQ